MSPAKDRIDPWNGFHAAWTACVGMPGYDKSVWMLAEKQMVLAGPRRGMDTPAPEGIYEADDKLGHEFEILAIAAPNARIPMMEGTKLCKHCGLEDWSRRRNQECPVRLRAALTEART